MHCVQRSHPCGLLVLQKIAWGPLSHAYNKIYVNAEVVLKKVVEFLSEVSLNCNAPSHQFLAC